MNEQQVNEILNRLTELERKVETLEKESSTVDIKSLAYRVTALQNLKSGAQGSESTLKAIVADSGFPV